MSKNDSIYEGAKKFWDQAFEMDEKEMEEYKKEADVQNGWKELAPAEKLRDVIVEHLAGRSKVLDYGCGEGWAGITLSKSGCKDVTCVDVVENAIVLTNFFKEIYGIKSGFKAECVSDNWIIESPTNVYDGIFCSNVIDVLPSDIAGNIIENIARIATPNAKVIISMNYYAEPISNPERGIEIKNENQLFVNGILRMVTRTDEEWEEIFSHFFDVEDVVYFAWPGETEAKRRIFILSKKTT